MKKKILAVALLQFLLVLNACSGPESQPGGTPDEKGEITADYITGFTNDFIISSDNTLYTIGQRDMSTSLKKVGIDGTETILNNLDLGTYTHAKLAFSSNEDVLMVAKGNDTEVQDKIMRFENNFTELKPFYTMTPISSPFASKINLFSICNNNDNTYFVFDYNARNIKRVVTELNGDVFVAGSGKNEIKDGSGLDASFGFVTKIISLNGVLYLIDEFYDAGTYKNASIRKVEYLNNEWKVTTLVTAANGDRFLDITFDTKNELYVVIAEKGIYKLNLENNTLSVFKDGELKIKAPNRRIRGTFKAVEMVKFKGDDIYLLMFSEVVKFSDYQTKFAEAEK